MGVIYSILEALIPFEFIDYAFMKNALIAIILVTPVFAILGTMIVNNKMAFFSDALGHSALTGIALGMVLGISNMNISMILFAVVFNAAFDARRPDPAIFSPKNCDGIGCHFLSLSSKRC